MAVSFYEINMITKFIRFESFFNDSLVLLSNFIKDIHDITLIVQLRVHLEGHQ